MQTTRSPVLPNTQGGRLVPSRDKESLWEAAEVDKVTEKTFQERQAENERLNIQVRGKEQNTPKESLRKRSRNQLKMAI